MVGFITAHGLSSCGEWGLLFVAVCGLLLTMERIAMHRRRHTGSVAAACGLQSTGGVVVMHGLSCSEACGSSQSRD